MNRPRGVASLLALALSGVPLVALAQDPAPEPLPAAPSSSAPTPVATQPPPPASSAASTEPRLELRQPVVAAPSANTGRFEFGSYGRVNIASDLRGKLGRPANIVAHGTRIDEDSYAELELRREDDFGKDIHTRVVATLALFPPFFHFSGKPEQAVGVRNLYAQATYGKYTLWAGSRMYRGDDIYLLNWWPLDNQNTVGGGAAVKFPPETGDTIVAAHVGMQRLDNPYQFQQIPAVAPFGVGSVNVTYTDRPRTVETLKITHFVRSHGDKKAFDNPNWGFKVSLYGEAHQIAAGNSLDREINLPKSLPAESGWLVGSQVTFWTGERDSFLALFFRHARGIAAYDPLAVPTTFSNDRTTSDATETQIALGGNFETGPVGVLYGAYLRWFRDGNPAPTSINKYDEGSVVVRPQLFLGEHWGVAAEGSYQQRRHAYLDRGTDAPLTASLLRGGLMPFFSPSGRGSFKRPQFRLIYAITSRNSGARALYPREDIFASRDVEHFIGLGAEWWFNFSSYP